MSENFILSWNKPESHDRVDLVFENRFKGYGAYVIRQNYSKNKVWGMILSVLLFVGVATGIYVYQRMYGVHVNVKNRIDNIENNLKKPKTEIKKEPEKVIEIKKTQKVKANAFVVPTPDPEATNITIVKILDQLDRVATTDVLNGSDNFNPDDGSIGNITSDGTDDGQIFGLGAVDADAVFTGGDEAFVRFVQENFVYPERCQEEGINGSVEITFIVNQVGYISKPQVTKKCPTCPEFETEALRVLALTNGKWTAAVKNKKPVIAYRKVPISLRVTTN